MSPPQGSYYVVLATMVPLVRTYVQVQYTVHEYVRTTEPLVRTLSTRVPGYGHTYGR